MNSGFQPAITPQFIVDLLLILTVAWVFGGLFMRFGLPVMLGGTIGRCYPRPCLFWHH